MGHGAFVVNPAGFTSEPSAEEEWGASMVVEAPLFSWLVDNYSGRVSLPFMMKVLVRTGMPE